MQMDTADRAAVILAIAKETLRLTTLETRNSDDLDFHDLSVWYIREALEATYDAGFLAATERKREP